MNKSSWIITLLIMTILVIQTLVVVIVGDWIAHSLGMTGLTYYCTVFLFWLIITGLLGKLLND